jgi:tetratricopeptide (TPR) repeat protein
LQTASGLKRVIAVSFNKNGKFSFLSGGNDVSPPIGDVKKGIKRFSNAPFCHYTNKIAPPSLFLLLVFRKYRPPMMMMFGSHALYNQTERLLLLPWTCQPTMYASVERLKNVLTFLLTVYSNFWVETTGSNALIKNLSKLLETRFDPEIPIKELGIVGQEMLDDLAKMHKARYLLTGHVRPLTEGDAPSDRAISVLITLQLYDAQTENWVLNHTLTLSYFEPHCNTLETLHPVVWHLEDCFKKISAHLLSFMVTPANAIKVLQEIDQFRLSGDYQLLVQLMATDVQPTPKLKLEALQQLNQAYPTNLLVAYFLAKQYKQGRQYLAAIETFKCVVDVPHFPPKFQAQTLNEMGSCAALLGEQKEALTYWLNAIEKDNTFVLAYMNIAHAYEEMGLETQSEEYLKNVIQLAPADARIYYS